MKKNPLSKLPVEDLRAIGHFHRIIKNYLKMKVIEKRSKTKTNINEKTD